MVPLILSLLLGAQTPSFIYQDPAADQAIRHAMDATYKLDLVEARSTARSLQLRLPDHPVGYALDAETYWWEAQVDPENQKVEDAYDVAHAKAVDVAEKALNGNKFPKIETTAYLASAYGSKARFLLTQHGVGWGTVRTGMKAHNYAEEVYRMDPTYVDILVGIGAYNYFAGRVPSILKPFAWLFGAHGDAELGLQQLRTGMERGRYTKTESRIVLFTALMKDKQYAESFRLLDRLLADFPNNYALYPWVTEWYRDQGKNLEGAELFERMYSQKASRSPRMAQYALFEKAQLENAHARPAQARTTLDRLKKTGAMDAALTRRIQAFEKTLKK